MWTVVKLQLPMMGNFVFVGDSRTVPYSTHLVLVHVRGVRRGPRRLAGVLAASCFLSCSCAVPWSLLSVKCSLLHQAFPRPS